MSKKIAVVDGNSLMHRAYHAVPPAMTAPDGTPTNAAFGFLSMLFKFIETAQPDAIICAFDRGRPAFRMKALEQYKAQRPPMDEDLKVQFPLIENLLAAMNIPVVALKGWEGDDILGTIAAQDEALGYQTMLVTGDKDAYQLASELTSIMTTKKGITDVVIYGPAEVEERYGVKPEQVPDFLGLKGDKSDNIPGVPGIGEKRAAAMLQEYGTLEGIYEHLDAFKGKQRENLENNKEAAFLSREVATIVRDVDIDIDLESVHFPDFDTDGVIEAFTNVRFMAHLNKVLSFSGDGQTGQASKAKLKGAGTIKRDADAHHVLSQALSDNKSLSLAWQMNPQASLFGSQLTVAINEGDETALFTEDEALSVALDLIKHHSCAVLDAKEFLQQFVPPDSSQTSHLINEEVLNADLFDVALAAYDVNSSQSSYDLAALAERYGGIILPDEDNDDQRLANEAAALAVMVPMLRDELEKHDLMKVYTTIDYPLVGVLVLMERVGAALDVDALARISKLAHTELEQLRTSIYELAGEEFNVDSPKQLAHILFEVIGLKPLKKNQRGYSTDAKVLKELSKEHKLPELVLKYREFAKIASTYVDALPRMCRGDGRLHTSFNEMVTTTGRLSSSDPNLQNIPVRTDLGRQIREGFVGLNEGDLFMSADYSQIELRLLAHLSGDEGLIDSFLSGTDFHAQTASRVFNIPVDEVTPLLRSRAKAVNFGIVYGQQAFGLSQSLDIPFYEAKEMIERYFEVHPRVRHYLDDVVKSAYECGYAETLYGRRRYIAELKSRNAAQRGFGERTAMNHPMQGSAADIIKIAMRQVQEALLEGGYKTRLMLQVHDELDLSVPREEVDEISKLVKQIMESVVKLSVPLVVDVSAAENWAQAH